MTKADATTSGAQPSAITAIGAEQFQDVKLSPILMRQVLLGLQSNQRQSNAQAKTRGQVAGSTRKPWRQKGTGRARVGSKRTPLWRGGGIIFGPDTARNWSKSINRRVARTALLAALSTQAAQGAVWVAGNQPNITKTKDVIGWLGAVLDPKNNLLVLAKSDPSLTRSLRNISYINISTSRTLNPLAVMSARKIIFLSDALTTFNERVTQ